jgi:tagatose 6-phosphate kinase
LASEWDVETIVDCVGAPLLAAASAQPTILKMNRAELAQSYGVTGETLSEVTRRVRALAGQKQLNNLVITCGADGILAVTRSGAFLATAPRQQEVNAAGAGDAVSGVLAWRLGQRESWPAALRQAAAVGAAVVLTERTAECRPEDVERLLAQVTVEEIQ